MKKVLAIFAVVVLMMGNKVGAQIMLDTTIANANLGLGIAYGFR
jgi:hypothetical protein